MLELLAMAVDTSSRVPNDCVGFKISYQFYPAWDKFPYSAWIEIDKIASRETWKHFSRPMETMKLRKEIKEK